MTNKDDDNPWLSHESSVHKTRHKKPFTTGMLFSGLFKGFLVSALATVVIFILISFIGIYVISGLILGVCYVSPYQG